MATSGRASNTERNVVLGLTAAVLGCIVLFAFFGPTHYDEDRSPSTYNAGSAGTKAAYLLSGDLGYDVERWTQAPTDLRQVDAASTTLVLNEPILPVKSLDATQASVNDFLARGGRVLATGTTGARLLPGGKTAEADRLGEGLCYTRAEGPGELARTNGIALAGASRWDAAGPQFHVEQRCSNDAVVVSYRFGKGEAVWWSSPMPISNAGLKDDRSLALSLASLGPASVGGHRRRILFDEYLHTERERGRDLLAGLPWLPFWMQIGVIAAMLIFSFSRRRGPIRLPVNVPRTSPVEFAASMGRLYSAANATQAPLDAARARMLQFLGEECGLSRDLLRQAPAVIAEALEARIGGDWENLAAHLTAAANAADSAPNGRLALKLVQALEADRREIEAQVSAARQTVGAL